jgi:hypothetical protein
VYSWHENYHPSVIEHRGKQATLYTHMPFMWSRSIIHWTIQRGSMGRVWDANHARLQKIASEMMVFRSNCGSLFLLSSSYFAIIVPCSNSISLSLLGLLQRPHRAMQCMPMVSSELGICAFEGRVSVGLRLFDTAEVET